MKETLDFHYENPSGIMSLMRWEGVGPMSASAASKRDATHSTTNPHLEQGLEPKLYEAR